MIFDSHIHTEFSTDSKMKINEVLSTAQKNNIGVIITEHIDLDYPNPTEFRCDIPSYFNSYENYRGSKVGIGIEIGLSLDKLVENGRLAKDNNFDFVLGSIHTVNGIDIYSDYSKITTLSKEEYYHRYLEYMLKCINASENFDSLSHIDYPCRYSPFENKEIILSSHIDIIAEIMRVLLSKGKVMELNTARLNNPTSQHALINIYKLYKDLGGKYLTLGSDAHTPDAISRNFKIATEILNTLGLTGVYFKERQMNLI